MPTSPPLKWIDFEFHENWHSEAHVLLKCINEMLPYFLILLHLFW